MIRFTAPGGTLLLQYLNGTRIRTAGRIVVKETAPEPDQSEIWLRHHFEAGGGLYFHSYVLKREGAGWSVDVRSEQLVDLPPERLRPILEPHFERIEFFEGLTGRPFHPEDSDALGIVATGRGPHPGAAGRGES